MEDKKTIADRLRESLNIINHVKTFNEAAPVGEGTDGKKLFCPKDTIRFIADEIERYYIPRPRDKDGKPWDIDASCIVNGEECKIAGFDGDGNINVEDGDSNTFFWIGEGYVKRPTPKVLDPNGVEFAKDDIVYGKSGIEYKVLLLTPNAPHPITALRTDGTPGYCVLDADDLAHEKPVLDADGVTYDRGQKVWRINDGEWFYVEAIKPNGKLNLKQGGLGEMHLNADPLEFTHREPDSVSKVCDMLSQYARSDLEYSQGQLKDAVSDAVSRLTALIEMGA